MVLCALCVSAVRSILISWRLGGFLRFRTFQVSHVWGYNAGELIAKEPRGLSRTLYYISAALFLAAIALLLVAANMRKELSHDEYMYVAGGELLERGLLPYRDYPYLQMPNLAFAYAGIFGGTGHLLLAARLFNTL